MHSHLNRNKVGLRGKMSLIQQKCHRKVLHRLPHTQIYILYPIVNKARSRPVEHTHDNQKEYFIDRFYQFFE